MVQHEASKTPAGKILAIQLEIGGSQSGQRQAGRLQVLSVIRSAGEIARIDIASLTGGSPATVTAITAELIEEGLIEEVAPETKRNTSPRGRPRVALKIRGAAHLVAGIKVSAHSATVCFLDFKGQSIGGFESDLPAAALTPEEMVAFIKATLLDACAANGLKLGALSGVGLGVSGIVDAERGFVYWSPTLSARNVRLQETLAAALPLPVFIDNDANLVAKAEQLFGEGKDESDFVVITVEQGVGMGIVIDSRVYRGTRGCGAEFGHTKVQLDGALCRCGQRGCLEAYVSDYALLREASILGLPNHANTPAEHLDALFNAAKNGNSAATSVFDRASRIFAMGLANIINIFDPKLIILSGERMKFDYFYAQLVLDCVKANILQIDAPLPEIRIHKWGDLMWAKGAAAYAMENVTDTVVREMSNNAN